MLACPAGLRYGPGCVNECARRHCNVIQHYSCDSKTGLCPGGCLPGYWKVDCTQGNKAQNIYFQFRKKSTCKIIYSSIVGTFT